MRHSRSVRLVEAGDAAQAEVPAPADAKAAIEIWTDGACRGNPGPGGWGALLRSGAHVREMHGGERDTTNNRMELTAVIEALGAVKRASRIIVHTDSQYVRLGITEWMAQWKRRGWKTSDNKPVKNQELWQRLAEMAAAHHVDWRWVKGHAGDAGNERADALANQGVDEVLGPDRLGSDR
jgi:ribonuclease HI